MEAKYCSGDLVFAKVRGSPYWPACVLEEVSFKKVRRYSVFYYGTGQTGYVSEHNLCDYKRNKHILGNNRRALFSCGIEEIEKELSNREEPVLSMLERIARSYCDENAMNFLFCKIEGMENRWDEIRRDMDSVIQKWKLTFEVEEYLKHITKLLETLTIEGLFVLLTCSLCEALSQKVCNLDKAIVILNDLKKLPLSRILLKKHANEVFIIARLVFYYIDSEPSTEAIELFEKNRSIRQQNAQSNDLIDDIEQNVMNFETCAHTIRKTAEEFCIKFISMFNFPPENMMTCFKEEACRFQKATKGLSFAEVMLLIH